MALPPPGGSNKGRRDREGKDIGPQEAEYGRAICCNATDSGTLRENETKGGDTGPLTMVGADRHRLEAGAGEERKCRGGGRKDRSRNGREDNSDAGDRVIGSGTGIRGGGVTGVQWLQWGGVERGRRLGQTLTPDDRRYTGFIHVAN